MRQIVKPPSLPERIRISHDLPYDPTCGYDLAALSAVEPPADPPKDFVDFWQDTYRQARSQEDALEVEMRPVEVRTRSVRVYQITYRSWDGLRTGGWLVEPGTGDPQGLMVHGHGYGGVDVPVHGWARRGFAVLFVCARGFSLSAQRNLPDHAEAHVLHGIHSREAYILRGCVAELWHAATVLLQRYPAARHSLVFYGVSFGGGLGALMLPWDDRFQRAFLGVPTFGHHPLRLQFQRGGSGLSVREYWLAHPDVEAVLPYYDAATAATHIRIPVLTEVALFDPCVCPPGQWAVANAIRSCGSRTQVVPCAHFAPPSELLSHQERATLGHQILEFLAPWTVSP
jgi:cephalosporin-C deacetylase